MSGRSVRTLRLIARSQPCPGAGADVGAAHAPARFAAMAQADGRRAAIIGRREITLD